jgi:hypothetical protein
MRLALAPPQSVTHATLCKLHVSCWLSLIAIAVTRGWFTRYEFDGDSLSYLDIARAIAENHARVAVNAYWSPGYPLFLSFFLRLLRPNLYWECPLVHFVNVLIFVGTLASFSVFWSEVYLWHKSYSENSAALIPEGAFYALGYSAFAIAALNLITVGLVGPDLLVAAFCCLAGWTILRFRRSQTIRWVLLMGFTLGLGFYAKAPFLPIGLVFVLCSCLQRPLRPKIILFTGSAIATLLLICAPYIGAISSLQGHLTFGESARLSEAFYIDGVQYYVHWQGGPSGAGMPVHPTRKISDSPEIYEFASEDMGTYPPWFDPA